MGSRPVKVTAGDMTKHHNGTPAPGRNVAEEGNEYR